MIKSIIIILNSIAITIYYGSYTIWLNFRGKLNRKVADKIGDQWAKRLLKAAQVGYSINNPYHVNLDDGHRYLLMSNHQSLYDIPIVMAMFDKTMRGVAKKEVLKIPFLGKALKACEAIFIDRNNREQAIKDLAYAKERMDNGLVVWIAPEGTRSHTGKLGSFKKGGFVLAIESQAHIVPLIMQGTEKILAAKSWRIKPNQHVTITIGKPIDAGKFSIKQRNELLELTHKNMTLMLNNQMEEKWKNYG